jgi:hypothetical protein
VRVTHPFHPLTGSVLQFPGRSRCWRGDIVFYLDEDGRRASIPAAWTDVVADDAFRVMAAGRCPFRTEDLLALADLVDRGFVAGQAGVVDHA